MALLSIEAANIVAEEADIQVVTGDPSPVTGSLRSEGLELTSGYLGHQQPQKYGWYNLVFPGSGREVADSSRGGSGRALKTDLIPFGKIFGPGTFVVQSQS